MSGGHDGSHGGGPPERVAALFSSELTARLIRLRRELHQNPELAFEEEWTATRLERELTSLRALDVRRVAGTGVVARIPGRDRSAPLVAIRGDIDALPIQEETGRDFASRIPGRMHACGHDVHATWAVGAAALLLDQPATGDVLILLQPAEETGQGASAVLSTGALADVEAIFGGHVDRRFAVGTVVAQEGPLAAAADSFRIILRAGGAHGARPQDTADPIVGAAAVVMALQTIVSRILSPAALAVVTVGTIHGGTAPNIIPDLVELSGTLRSFDPGVRAVLHEEVRRIAETVAHSYRLEVSAEIELGPPPVVNPTVAAGWGRRAAGSVLGADALANLPEANMGGEDFACYLERIPGCFLRIGAREPGGEVIPAHNPRFDVDEGAIFVGAAVLAETARVASAALRAG
jgi:amidohydrolase